MRAAFLLPAIALLVSLVPAAAPASSSAARSNPPHMLSHPTVHGKAQVGAVLRGDSGGWSGTKPLWFSYTWLRCGKQGRCGAVGGASAPTLKLTSSLAGARVRLQVKVRNSAGTATGVSALTAVVAAPPTAPPAGLTPGMYFSTLPAGSSLPRADDMCASLITRRSFEPRPDNKTANNTVPPGKVTWPTANWVGWTKWLAKRSRVTGNYTGTTDEILRWGACKWGLDENTLRAVAVQESYWHQSTVGDNGSSFGLMQVKDHTSDGKPDFGGYPWTQKSTPLNVDFYGAWIRSCLDGDFYDGGDWLYHGRKVTNDLWGCVGAWFSGSWHDGGAEDYVSHVQQILAKKGWLSLGR
jgi:transglycosylase-like protein with SLT domain